MAGTEQTATPSTWEAVCQLCKTKYSSEKRPKLLPCLHTFCEPCLDERMKAVPEGTSPTCPDCSVSFSKQEMIEDLFMMEIVKESEKGDKSDQQEELSPKCTACEEDKDATSFCTQCSDWLCEQCVQAHKRVRVTKDHVIEPKGQAQLPSAGGLGSVNERYMYCSRHPHEPLKLFCETCDKLTCRDCQLLEHKEHRYQFVPESSAQSKSLLNILIENLKKKKKNINQAQTLINERQQSINSKQGIVQDQIKKNLHNLVAEFTKRAQAILRDLGLVCIAKRGHLMKRGQDVAALSRRIDHCLKFVQAILDKGTSLSILHSKSFITRQLQSLLQARCEVPNPNHEMDIRYSHDSGMFLKSLHHLGLLYVDGIPFRPEGMPVQPPPNGAPATSQSQNSIGHYIHELQRLSSDQRSRVFNRMAQLQKAGQQVTEQNLNMPTLNVGILNPAMMSPQQIPGNPYPGGLPPGHPGQSRQMPQLIPRPQNNGVPPPHVTPVPNFMQPSNGLHRPPANTQNPIQNSGLVPSNDPTQKNRRWVWHNLSNSAQYPQGMMGNGPPNKEVRPSSSNSAPEDSASPPTGNSTRPLSADSIVIKQEKSPIIEGFGGLNSCSYANKENRTSVEQNRAGLGQPVLNNNMPVFPNQPTRDPLEEALRTLSEDGLSVGLNQLGDSTNTVRHGGLSRPIADKQIDSPDPSEDYCACCHNGGELLCCDYCPKVFHFQCHIPTITMAPSGSWRCTLSLEEKELRLEKTESREIIHSQKRKTPVGLSDRELKACERILLELFSHEASTAFHEPVSKSVPEYYRIITNPMDFTTVRCKLSKQHFNHYHSVQDFLYDVKLVFSNCAKYNSEPSEVGRAGKTVKKFFEELVDRFLPYYLPFVKDEKLIDANVSHEPPQHLPPAAPASHSEDEFENEHLKGSKRRKMDKNNVIHYF